MHEAVTIEKALYKVNLFEVLNPKSFETLMRSLMSKILAHFARNVRTALDQTVEFIMKAQDFEL